LNPEDADLIDHPDDDRLQLYLRGYLSRSESGALERHLSGCIDCKLRLADAARYVARILTIRRSGRGERKRSAQRFRALTSQLLSAQERERRRIARELHDEVTQTVAGVAMQLGLLRSREIFQAAEHDLAAVHESVLRLADTVRAIAHALHPAVLEHAGLAAALEVYCSEASRLKGMAIQYSAKDVPDNIPAEIQVTLYRIAQEAVGNAIKHSGAPLVEVTLRGVRDAAGAAALGLTIADNGRGFAIEKARRRPGLGLVSIQERLQLVEGRLSIHSAPGQGTRLEIEVRLP